MVALLRVPIHPNPAMYTSPEMVADIAFGKDPVYDIAARYGLENAELDWLMAQEWFARQVAETRMKLEDNGLLWEEKARRMAQEVIQGLFKLNQNDELSHPLRIELVKILSAQGNMTPKQGSAASGDEPRFMINFQINGVDQLAAKRQRLDIEPEKPPVTMSLAFDPPVPSKPEGFTLPDFDTRARRDLIGSPAAVQAAVALPPVSR